MSMTGYQQAEMLHNYEPYRITLETIEQYCNTSHHHTPHYNTLNTVLSSTTHLREQVVPLCACARIRYDICCLLCSLSGSLPLLCSVSLSLCMTGKV